MKRARRNRKKPPKRELPRLPKLPQLPRISVNIGAVFAGLAAIVVTAVAVSAGRDLLELPVRRLEIDGSFQRVSKLDIEAAVRPVLGQSFVSIDLNDVRGLVADLDWVDTVAVRRSWPDTIKIAVTEHRAAAQWGDSGLLNARGELFTEQARQEYRELPKLAGPSGSHERVAARYLTIADRVARTTLTLDTIVMDARGAFRIDFKRGLSVRIGRDDVDARIDRFFDYAWPELVGAIDDVAYVDMRYPNGFAVGWREPTTEDAQLARLDTDG